MCRNNLTGVDGNEYAFGAPSNRAAAEGLLAVAERRSASAGGCKPRGANMQKIIPEPSTERAEQISENGIAHRYRGASMLVLDRVNGVRICR